MRDGRSMLGGIKARLGFGEQQGDYDDEYYGDEYDDYDFDFDEDEDTSDEYCSECAIEDDAQKAVAIEDNTEEEK